DAFSNCSMLTNINLSKVSSIDGSFSYCKSLKSVDLSSIKTLGDYSFHECDSINELIIGREATQIGVSAFKNCNQITSIDIPASVTSIEENSFECAGLSSLRVHWQDPGNVSTNIGFLSVDKSICILYVPFGTKEKYMY